MLVVKGKHEMGRVVDVKITDEGVLIPHPLLEDWGDIQEVEIEQRADALVVKPKVESSSRLRDRIVNEMKAAGLIEELPWTPHLEVSNEARARLAEKLSQGRPLSELILEDREDRA
jgi:hypothetical protein